MNIKPNVSITPSNLQDVLDTFEIGYETPADNFIGTFISRTIDLTLAGNSNQSLPAEIKLAIGIDNEAQINQPTFLITKVEKNEDSQEIKIKGFDYSIKFDEYFDLQLSYPLTLGALAQAICNKIGVQLASNSFSNSDFIMTKAKIDEKNTYREIIGMIASAMGGIAFINNSDKLEFKKLTTNSITIDNVFEQLLEVEKTGPINYVALAREPIEDTVKLEDTSSITANGKTEIRIVNNYLVDDNREGAIQQIFNNLNSKQFYSGQISTYQAYKVNPFDIVTVNSKPMVITDLNIKFPMMLDGYIGNKTLSKVETRYNTAKGLEKRLKDAEAYVDRVNGQVNLVAKSLEEVEGTLEEEIGNLQSQIDGAIQFWNGDVIPTLNNYPANNWKTEDERNNHRADIYTVIEDVDGELKQGKSYRFDKVGTSWVWVELTDNELSAVQALAQSKAKVFVTQPKPPYNIGDLWLNNQELYECKTSKSEGGNFSTDDWKLATKYTDDTKANQAQSTADKAVTDASTASGKADKAQETANQGVADAKTANDKATQAQTTANQGVADAKTANDNAIKAQGTADKAVTDASTANKKAEQALSSISDLASDNKLTPDEKQSTLKEFETIQLEKQSLTSRAQKYGVDTSNYISKYNALSTYLNPLLTDLTTTSDIVGTTFRNNFKAYYEARSTLELNISNTQKELVDVLDNKTTIIATTSESKDFQLTDSADNYCKSVEIFGESTQETRSGKNILPSVNTTKTINGVTFTHNSDGSITINGTASAKTSYPINSTASSATRNVPLKANTDYILSGCSKGSSSTYTFQIWYMKNEASQYITNSTTPATFSTVEETLMGAYIIVFAGTTVSNVTIYPMITLASETDQAYEPYGAMPSPEFPSLIKSIKSKNEFDISKIENTAQITNNGDGTLTLANTTTANGYSSTGKKLSELCPDLRVGDVVALSMETTAPSSMLKIYIGETWIPGVLKKITQTMLDAAVVLYGGYNQKDTIKNIQIEKNMVSTFFAPYNSIYYKSTGKNLFNTSKIQNYGDFLEKYNNGFKLTRTENGRISPGYVINLEPNQTYTLSADLIENTTTTSGLLLIWKTEDGTSRYVPNLDVDGNKLKAVINWHQKIVSVAFYIQDTQAVGTYIKIDNLQLEKGENYTAFEEYKENIITVPLLHPLRSLPNGTRDRIFRDNGTGKWYDEQNVQNIKIKDAIWYYSTASLYFYAHRTDMKITEQYNQKFNGFCTIYAGTIGKPHAGWADKPNNTIGIRPTTDYICIKDTNFADVNELLTARGEEIIQYELAEPIISEITDQNMINALEAIRTYAGTTNIETQASSILTYYRNVPIANEYETKSNAEKKYKITQEKFAEQEITNEQIRSSVFEVNKTITDNYATKEELSTEIKQTSQNITLSVNNSIEDLKNKGVPKVVSKIVTIDDNGLTVGSSDSQFTNTMNNTGNYQYNAGVLIAKYDKDGAEIPRLKSDYAIIGNIKYTKEDVGGITHNRAYVLELE